MLRLSAVSLDYGGTRVCESLAAQAAVGTMTAILGPNGAGKSTLLASLAGEHRPVAGTMHWGEADLYQQSPHWLARHRAVLPQASVLAFDLTVAELVALGAAPFPEVPPVSLAALQVSILTLVDLEEMGTRPVTALSGGERQRAQIARVLMQASCAASLGPALLLLDEPTASLDPRHQHQLMIGLKALIRQLPLVVVTSLHDVNLAARYADAIWLLAAGRMVAQGAPCEVLTAAHLSAVYGLPVCWVDGAGVVFG
jgi:iron complex transport system ATP-binding protein